MKPGGVEKLQPCIPMSTSASLGSVCVHEGGLVLIGIRGRSGRDSGVGECMMGSVWLLVSFVGIVGSSSEYVNCSSSGSNTGASVMWSDRGVVDTVMEQMVRGDGVVCMARGCLL